MRLVRGNALINEIGAIRQARAAGQLSLVEAIDEGLSSLSQKRRTKAKQCDLVLCQKGQELISMRLRCQLSTRSLREGSVRVKPFLHLIWLKSVACNHGQIQETTTHRLVTAQPGTRSESATCPLPCDPALSRPLTCGTQAERATSIAIPCPKSSRFLAMAPRD